jgi:4-diphosphocytidyl-2-C-methyl-D-erythritol kinase
MESVSVAAPAKLNLLLRVGPAAGDGYHPISSLMVTLDAPADRVTVRPAAVREVRCPGLDGPANLAWAALDALERVTGRPLRVAVEIAKEIPQRAGLGGGSSDAAATLVAVDRLLGLGLGAGALEAAAAEVGSDVPFFVRGGAQWAEGRGERLRPADAVVVHALIAMPDGGLSTAEVYRAFDRLGRRPAGGGDPEGPVWRWAANDLWPAALALRPDLGALARALRAAGARRALLCGSGAAVAGLFADRAGAERAAAALAGGRRVWVARQRDIRHAEPRQFGT